MKAKVSSRTCVLSSSHRTSGKVNKKLNRKKTHAKKLEQSNIQAAKIGLLPAQLLYCFFSCLIASTTALLRPQIAYCFLSCPIASVLLRRIKTVGLKMKDSHVALNFVDAALHNVHAETVDFQGNCIALHLNLILLSFPTDVCSVVLRTNVF